MLDEYKIIYEDYANTYLKDWQLLNKNDLCNRYLDAKEPLRSAYLSAIIFKYWFLIEAWYNSQAVRIATEEDCYEVVIECIQYSLERHVWTEPNNKLYKDPNGPDKAINIHIKSMKTTFYQTTSKDKRKLNYAILSLDLISENKPEDFYLEDLAAAPEDQSFENYIQHFIRDKFFHGDSFLVFMIDTIINNDVFILDTAGIDNSVVVSQRKLTGALKNLNRDFAEAFSARYDIPLEKILLEIDKINVLSYKDLTAKIKFSLLNLTYNRDFMRWLRS